MYIFFHVLWGNESYNKKIAYAEILLMTACCSFFDFIVAIMPPIALQSNWAKPNVFGVGSTLKQ